jgi:hypothetical protein
MRTIRPLPEYETVAKLLDYDEETGEFHWKVRMSWRVREGDKAGGMTGTGYLCIGICGEIWPAHRLAWLLSVGDDPGNKVIDHIDENPLNNRIDNLRRLDNHLNTARSRTPKCCAKQAWNGRYQAVYTLEGVKHYLGTYDTEEEASKVGRQARKEARAYV